MLSSNVEAHSSSGLGHRPLKAEIRGSNPLCATISGFPNPEEPLFLFPLLVTLRSPQINRTPCVSGAGEGPYTRRLLHDSTRDSPVHEE
jgi:hypothetical protein